MRMATIKITMIMINSFAMHLFVFYFIVCIRLFRHYLSVN